MGGVALLSIPYIAEKALKLYQKHGTRNPYQLCYELDIDIHYRDLGDKIKAYYFCHSRIRSIVLNSRLPEEIRRILAAHELGHDRLHQDVALSKAFQEFRLFDSAVPAEYQANLFAAELLIDDCEILDLLNDDSKSFYGIASELFVPPELLDFKYRILQSQGFHVRPPNISNGDFLKYDMALPT